MKNFVQNGDRISFPATSVVTANSHATAYNAETVGSGPKSGEAGVVGRIVGVVVSDAVNQSSGPTNDGNVVLDTKGTYQLTVNVIHKTVQPGATIYIDPVTGAVSDDYTAVPFGLALDQAVSGTSTSIRVKVFGQGTPGASGADS